MGAGGHGKGTGSVHLHAIAVTGDSSVCFFRSVQLKNSDSISKGDYMQ